MESLLQVGGGGQSVLEATGGGGQRLKSVSHTYIQGERGPTTGRQPRGGLSYMPCVCEPGQKIKKKAQSFIFSLKNAGVTREVHTRANARSPLALYRIRIDIVVAVAPARYHRAKGKK